MDEGPWKEYARLQSILHRTIDAHKAAGIEAALTDLLEKISAGEPCTPKQTKNLVVNRMGRERRRRAIVHAGRFDLVPEIANQGSAESRLTLARCEEVCGPLDFRLLLNFALGHSYGELAKASGANENTLKVRVYRLRQKISYLAA